MQDPTTAITSVPNSEVYRGTAVIGRQKIEPATGADWSLVRLDRAVPNHRPVPIRRTGKIEAGQAVHVIGHPVGLPLKLAGDSHVRDNCDRGVHRQPRHVRRQLRIAGFNSATHEVEGILVRGETDFVSAGTCNISLVCPTPAVGAKT